jgi:hypothetical protein
MKIETKLGTDAQPGQIGLRTIVGRGLWLFQIKRLLTHTVDALLAHRWTIIRSPAGINWLTSDDPVIRLNFESPTNYDMRGGWGSSGTEILLPLGPKHLLYTQIGRPLPKRGSTLALEHARMVQRFTVEHAHRYIFATEPDSLVEGARPRTVDAVAYRLEREQWERWHDEQTAAERDLLNKE